MPSVTKNPGQTFTMPAGTDGVLIIDATGKAADGTGGRGGGGGSFERVILNGVAQGTVFTVAYGGMGGVAVEVTNGVLGTVVLASGSQGQAGASTIANIGDFGYPGGAGGGDGSSSGAGGGAGSLAGPGSDGDAANGGDVGGGDALNNVGQNGTRGGGGSGPDGDGAGFGGDALFTYSDAGRTVTVTALDATTGIPGATVTLGSAVQATDASGAATFLDVADGSYSLSITRDAYVFSAVTVAVSSGHTSFQEQMTRKTAAVIPICDELVTLLINAAGSTGYTDAHGNIRNYMFGVWIGSPAASPIASIQRVFDVVPLLESATAKPAIYVQPIFPKTREESLLTREASNVTHKVGICVLAKLTAAPADITSANAEFDRLSGIAEQVAAIVKSMLKRQLPNTGAVLRQVEFPWLLHRDTNQTKQLFESEVVLTFFAPEVDQ